jgi:hypothetical protein
MGNSNGQAYAFMALTPVLPGRLPVLRARLGGLPAGERSPLARTETTHFARWMILTDLVYQGPPQLPDHPRSPYLIFISNFDGDRDRYLTDLLRVMPDEAEDIWSNCVGWPGARDLPAAVAYLRHNQIRTTFFVSAYPQATVAEVRRSLRLRRRLASFAVAAQSMDASTLRQEFIARFGESA